MGLFDVFGLARDYAKAKKMIVSKKIDINKVKNLIERMKKLIDLLYSYKDEVQEFINEVKAIIKELKKKGDE